MSRFLFCMTIAAAMVAASSAWAGQPKVASKGAQKGGHCASGAKGACGPRGCGSAACGSCHTGLLGGVCKHHHRIYEGQDPWAACGCNGSYTYPVPPLYTYHWRGIYKQKLMTDYHSPWRFPAIKPFQEEDTADVQLMESGGAHRPVTTARTEPSKQRPAPAPIRRVSAETGLGRFIR